MGRAIDTILAGVNVGGTATVATALTDATVANGDSFTVRAFGPAADARLEHVIIQAGTGTQEVRVKSPMLHDNVNGITFKTTASPSLFLMPRDIGQRLYSNDQLTVQADAAANLATMVALGVFYTDLPGAAARLASWGDIRGLVKSIKPVEVDLTTGASSNVWTDTVITTTEDLLHANTDYAVLGYSSDVNCGVLGIKGQETGNLRICGPGDAATRDTSDYFVDMSDRHGLPHIPVFNSANKDSVFVSAADNNLSTPVKAQLILAELSQLISV